MAGLQGRVFSVLLRLYPRHFRELYGEEMSAYFAARLARARTGGGVRSVLRLWLKTMLDVVGTAVAERRRRSRAANQSRTRLKSMSALLQDLGYAARRLRAAPLFTVSAMAILAVGIGLNASVFSIVDATLFRPVPFENADEIVHVYQDGDDGVPSSTSYPAYRDMAALRDVFAGVAATSSDGANLDAAGGPRQVAVDYATSSYFPVLGLSASRGRWFDAEHDHVGVGLVAVVSHRTWSTQFGADPSTAKRAHW